MLEIACYAIALTTAAWAVWVRRSACRISWERSTTYATAQPGATPGARCGAAFS
jgi:hypothetical protein